MNALFASYLDELDRHLDPRRADAILQEIREYVLRRVEARARKNQREPVEEDYRYILEGLGKPEEAARRFGADRYLIGPGDYGRFFGYLGLVFGIHLGMVLLSFVLDLPIWLFPSVPSGPYAARVTQFLLALPGVFIFDFGLTAMALWLLARWRVTLPSPPRLLTPLPSRRALIAKAVFLFLLLALLDLGHHYLLRFWSQQRFKAYELLGPGFTRGLPLLNLAVGWSMLLSLLQLRVRAETWRRILIFASRLVVLIGVSLFFTLPKLLIFPPFLDFVAGAGDIAARLLAVPVIICLAVAVVRSLLALWREGLRGDFREGGPVGRGEPETGQGHPGNSPGPGRGAKA